MMDGSSMRSYLCSNGVFCVSLGSSGDLPTLVSPVDSVDTFPWHLLVVRRALQVYLAASSSFRKSDSLFVSFGVSCKGCKASLSTISGMLIWLILLSYSLAGASPPVGIQGRSTRGISGFTVRASGCFCG